MEYTKLSGMYVQSLYQVYQGYPGPYPESLLTYELFALVNGLNAVNVKFYASDSDPGITVMLGRFLGLQKRFGNNKRLKKYILDYPFHKNSYLGVRSRQVAYRGQLPPLSKMLADYHGKLVLEPDDKKLFLRQVASVFGAQVCSDMMRDVLTEYDADLMRNDAGYRQSIAAFALDIGAHSVSQAILKDFPDCKGDVESQQKDAASQPGEASQSSGPESVAHAGGSDNREAPAGMPSSGAREAQSRQGSTLNWRLPVGIGGGVLALFLVLWGVRHHRRFQ